MNILALVPARSGSQRVPNKNIRTLGGQPLISYSIRAAARSEYVNRVICSTDSAHLAAIANTYGAETPFLRPQEISTKDSTELEFMKHSLEWLKENENYSPDLIVLLYPTSPFRRTRTIDHAIETMLADPRADSLRSIRLCSEHPYKMWVRQDKYIMPFVKDQNMFTLSYHLLPTVYVQNASIYITRPTTIFNKGSVVGDKILAFEMDELESVDINSELDLQFAEFLIKAGILSDHDIKLFPLQADDPEAIKK